MTEAALEDLVDWWTGTGARTCECRVLEGTGDDRKSSISTGVPVRRVVACGSLRVLVSCAVLVSVGGCFGLCGCVCIVSFRFVRWIYIYTWFLAASVHSGISTCQFAMRQTKLGARWSTMGKANRGKKVLDGVQNAKGSYFPQTSWRAEKGSKE